MTSRLPDDPRIFLNTFNVLITLICLLFIHFLLHHRNILHRLILIYFVAPWPRTVTDRFSIGGEALFYNFGP